MSTGLPPAPWTRQQFSDLKDEIVAADGRVVAQVFTRRIAGTLKSEQRIEQDFVGDEIVLAILKIAATCIWQEDFDGVWESECGEHWQFIEGGPKENRARYCHGCGRRVDVVPYGIEGKQ